MAGVGDDWEVIGDDLWVGDAFQALRIFRAPWAIVAARLEPFGRVVPPGPITPPEVTPPEVTPPEITLPIVPPLILDPGRPPDVMQIVNASAFLRRAVATGELFDAPGVGVVRFVAVDEGEIGPTGHDDGPSSSLDS